MQQKCHTPEIQAIIKDLRQLPEYKDFLKSRNGNESGDENDILQISQFVNYLIDKDLKLGPLKALQGYVWGEGYSSGKLKGQ